LVHTILAQVLFSHWRQHLS